MIKLEGGYNNYEVEYVRVVDRRDLMGPAGIRYYVEIVQRRGAGRRRIVFMPIETFDEMVDYVTEQRIGKGVASVDESVP